MDCPNCKKKLMRAAGDFFCKECNELFEVKDEKAVVIKDRTKWLSKVEKLQKDKLREVANSLGLTVEEEESLFPFI